MPRFSFTGGIYPSTFFMATGFHGFHVIVGTTFLAVCLFRAWRGAFPARPPFRLRGGGLVLALRRRGVAVPVRLRLLVGRGKRRRRSGRLTGGDARPGEPRRPISRRYRRCARRSAADARAAAGASCFRAAERSPELRGVRARPLGARCRRRPGGLCDLLPGLDRRRPRRLRRDPLLTPDLGPSDAVDAADHRRRARHAAAAQGWPDRAAIPAPSPRRPSRDATSRGARRACSPGAPAISSCRPASAKPGGRRS